ncbi:MAG: hypothetical protein IT384_08535 [Deltaproteobacteria bacterium]|nr:hypothetical protein [Deltaproteobacteria bacterium]
MVEAQFHRAAEKRKHPALPDLVLGHDLSHAALLARDDSAALGALIELLQNAEYWLSFELSSFEPLLSRCPSPLRELGVGIELRFGEGVDGHLSSEDLSEARRQLLPSLPADLGRAIGSGIEALEHAVAARDRLPDLEALGFASYQPASGLSVHGLRAGGRATILGDGEALRGDAVLPIGKPVVLTATDDRDKPLAPPEVENDLSPPLLAKNGAEDGEREVVFLVPGRYRLRVPGRAEGVKTVLVR